VSITGMGKGDIEAGFSHAHGDSLYPSMIESPELRWGFIRKVYTIVSIQLLLTAGVACFFMFFPPARDFVRNRLYCVIILIVAIIFTIIRNIYIYKTPSSYHLYLSKLKLISFD
jgi:protein lifeguard